MKVGYASERKTRSPVSEHFVCIGLCDRNFDYPREICCLRSFRGTLNEIFAD